MGILERSSQDLQRVIQESVPGKQVTIAHVIASPMPDICERLGIETEDALGILTLTPSETAIIAADMATKAADSRIAFLDRFTGSLLLYGDVQSVETSLEVVVDRLCQELEFTATAVTRS